MVSGGRTYMLDDATTRYMVQGTQPALRTYARQMGVSPALIDAAHRVPHTSIRTLSPSELARYGLVTEGLPRVRSTAPRKRGARRLRAARTVELVPASSHDALPRVRLRDLRLHLLRIEVETRSRTRR
jgi:hypothetical protein